MDQQLDAETLSTVVYSSLSTLSLENSGNSFKGWLMKQGSKVKNWKMRYFILKDNFLFYFTSSHEATPLGVIMLINHSVFDLQSSNSSHLLSYFTPPTSFRMTKLAVIKEYCFIIRVDNKDHYYCTTSDAEKLQWVTSLKNPRKWWERYKIG